MLERTQTPSFSIRLYLSGPLDIATQVCREFCLRGLCVTIEPTMYVFTGGEEAGYVVGLLNYPRFPTTFDKLHAVAVELAERLLMATHQRSALIVDEATTTWITRTGIERR